MKHKITRGKYKVPINDSTYRHVVKLRVLAISSFTIYCVIASLTAFFVYTNVYNAIGFVDLSVLATIDTGAEVIDFRTLELVDSAWTQKRSVSSTEFSRNPFVPVDAEISSSTPESTTTDPPPEATIEESI